MRYYVFFGLICIVLVGYFYPFIYNNSNWPPYVVWVAALSVTTSIMYGLDKALSKIGKVRTPELILHILAILGGFPGGWLGMVLFHHKTNIRKHLDIWAILALSTIGHAALIRYWFSGGN